MIIVRKLYIFWVLSVFTVFMIILLPGIIIPLLLGKRFAWIGYKFLSLWSWIFSMLTFIRYDLSGHENFKKGKSFIYVSNHTSFLDIPGLWLLIPGDFRPIAKKELLKIPVFGFIVKAAAIIVDRSSHESRKKSVAFTKNILAQKISMLIFAEGTQNRSKEILQPFKDGAFRIAIDTQTPILPIVIVGAGERMPPGTFNLTPGKIKIIAMEKISVDGLTAADYQILKQKTAMLMKEMIVRHHSSKGN